MARSAMAVFEARRKLVDDELSRLREECDNIERLVEQLERRRELVEGRYELLVAERDLLDERIWHGRRDDAVVPLMPRPPVVRDRAIPPRELAREPWDLEVLEAALAS
ncbi:MAG: hypothetical protein AB1Z98_18920 [Nannocystaceae bacterium]